MKYFSIFLIFSLIFYMKSNIEETYIKLSPIEHILKKPSMYIGDLILANDKQFIYENNNIIQKEIEWSPGLYKIIDESTLYWRGIN